MYQGVQFRCQLDKLPPKGYTYLIQRGYCLYGKQCVYDQDLASLMGDHGGWTQWQTMMTDYALIPAPMQDHDDYSHIFFAQCPDALYQRLQPVFQFDAEARFAMWKCLLRALLDHAKDTTRYIDLMNSTRPDTFIHPSRIVAPDPVLMDDQLLFKRSLYSLLAEFPPGACSDQTMSKFLVLCCRHLHTHFDIEEALNSLLLDFPSNRLDIYRQLAKFFQLTG
ncbi:hypothetical protein DM01DRAFT_1337629 [Hesseltinella vesiculosa]|uniref:Uncharacterized protein n=1 Tax=Hesseltinella vesiculosa TaxID=101127 RepID=A0A1X2GC60_9FUNG|nr:hypothetical protein DM01DRAFT_1337629 [Hesseltinella vesiculosa]